MYMELLGVRTHLPMHPQAWKTPCVLGANKPMGHDYWAHALDPKSLNY